MNLIYRAAIGFLMTGGLVGCSKGFAIPGTAASPEPSASATEATFRISADLSGIKRERTHFGTLPDSVTITLPYLFKYQGSEKKSDPQVLIANVTKNVGGKFESKNDGAVIAIVDGVGKYNCDHYFGNIAREKDDSEVPDVQCTFDILGAMPLKAVTVSVADQGQKAKN